MTPYQLFIKNHLNYSFLPAELKKTWTKVSKNGQNPRQPFWIDKRKELIDAGLIPKESLFANVARYIHPTKKHTCELCGVEHSIYYEYPTKNTWNWLVNLGIERSNKTIFEIYAECDKKEKLDKYFDMTISELEIKCKNDQYVGKKLSPGVLSNPPDRLDGFHSYNSICGCRSTKDKGRSHENMKSYTRDRRAYEMLSDGNCLKANALMGALNKVEAICFMCKKSATMTADHIGPISLGFVHDVVNFQACCDGCNSGKGNRITDEDIRKIKSKEDSGETMVSWWAKESWDKIKTGSIHEIRNALDDNAKKFLATLLWIKTNRVNVLEAFVNDKYINHEMAYKLHNVRVLEGDVTFEHTEKVSAKKTKKTQNDRTKEIVLSIDEKDNRKNKVTLSTREQEYLADIQVDTFKSKICRVLAGL
jgi:hypothetical protein